VAADETKLAQIYTIKNFAQKNTNPVKKIHANRDIEDFLMAIYHFLCNKISIILFFLNLFHFFEQPIDLLIYLNSNGS